MLRELNIKNFGIFADESITFKEGLTVLTGETGAGKSLIVGALSLILGGRSSSEDIRAGSAEASIEAYFDFATSKTPAKLKSLLETIGVPQEADEVIVRRLLSATGRGRILVNGVTVTVAQLHTLGELLIDLSGQHEHQILLNEASHQEFVDQYGGHEKLLEDYQQLFQQLHDTVALIQSLEEKRKSADERQQFLKYRIQELERLNLKPGEEEESRQTLKRMHNSIKLFELVQQGTMQLSEGEGAVAERLQALDRQFAKALEFDNSLEACAKMLKDAIYNIDEVVRTLQNYGEALNFDPSERDHLEERLLKLGDVQRKYGSIDLALQQLSGMRGELAGLENVEGDLQQFKKTQRDLESKLLRLGRSLSEARHLAATKLAKAVEKELHELALEGASFKVDLQPHTSTGREHICLPSPDAKSQFIASSLGLETVVCLFSANRGEALKPLVKVASGGELSRVLLAIKLVLAGGEAQTFIFDEIDSGIGGRQAEVVGRKLKHLSLGRAKGASVRQVLCVTHLAPIAAYGLNHLLIAKQSEQGRTVAKVELLEQKGRVQELARMLAGEVITAKTLEHAKEILQNAIVT